MINHLRIQHSSIYKVHTNSRCYNVIGVSFDWCPVASAPTNLMAVQEGVTSIRVSWSPPTPLGDTTGYRIYYSDSDSNDSVNVSGGFTEDYLLTGLVINATYTISIVAFSHHFSSDTVDQEIKLGEVG